MASKETTTTYQWGEGNVIRRIDVRHQKNGWAVAYLHADNSEAAREMRQNIRSALRHKGWGTLSDSRDGSFVLRVTGLRDGEQLIALLREHGAISTAPQVSTQGEQAAASSSLWQAMKSRSLRASGIFATIGNALSFTEGVLRSHEKKEFEFGQMGMGAAFALADLPLAIVDEKDNSRQLNLFLKKLRKHYERDNIEIPKSASIYVETSDQGKSSGERFQDFIHAYANQIKCGFEVAASFFSIRAGIEQSNRGKAIAGAIFGPGFLASLLIPEKKIDEEKYANAGKLGRLWMNIQANPLAVGGLLGYSNTVFTYASALDERRRFLYPDKYPTLPNPKTGKINLPSKYYKWDFVIPTDMIAANGFYAISKKTVGGDIKSDAMVQDAYRIAAQIINKQPEASREQAIESTARFFADRTEIKENYSEVIARLRHELDNQRQNPWFEKVGLPPKGKKAVVTGKAPLTDQAPTANDNLPAATNDNPTTTVAKVQREEQRVADASTALAQA